MIWSWWFVWAALVYATLIAPVSKDADLGAFLNVVWAGVITAPALFFFYYCIIRGFLEIGVFR